MEMVRYCPACDDEFRPDITVCSDCGATLILQAEGLGARGAAQARAAEDRHVHGDWRTSLDSVSVSSLLPVRTFDSLSDLEPAVAAFADIELPSRVLVQNGRYILLIHPSTLPAAQAALHEAQVDAEDAADTAFDATAGRYSNCPACGAKLSGDLGGACPECGLELTGPGGSVAVPEAE
jgi:hypothetical protein